MNDDVINRQAAIDAAIEAADEWDGGYSLTRANMIADAINNIAPSAQPERKKGKWILSDDQNPEDTRNGNYRFICSNCLHSDIHVKTIEVPFCWNCGAEMVGEQE